MTAKRPSSMRHLDGAIRRECGGDQAAYVRLRTLMANAVVARMLPDGVVKGRSAIKMRYGNARTRYTTDLDTATATDPAAYAELLGAALARGWEGFTGRVAPREPAHPRDVPEEYVMRPFDVRLAYLGKPWCTVPLEVGHDEIGDADAADWVDLEDAAAAFATLGFSSSGRGQAAAGVPRAGSCGGRWPRRFCCPDEALLEERRDGRVVRGDAVPQHADAPLPRGLAEGPRPLLDAMTMTPARCIRPDSS